MAALMLQKAIRQCMRVRSLELISPVTCQQIRFKSGKQRLKAPSHAQSKDKYVRRQKKGFLEKKVEKVDKDFLKKVPVDDVWIRKYYPERRYSMADAIHKHRELAQPEMLNNMDGLIYAEMTLDMITTKKAKFIKGFRETVLLPHQFDDQTQQKVAVFCETDSDIALAKEMGATYVGGRELVKEIVTGAINKDDIDHYLCVPDMLNTVIPIRPVVREKFPLKVKGNLNEDVKAMLELFLKGITFNCVKETDYIGKIQAPIGTLNMKDEEIEANYKALIPVIWKYKPQKTVHFVTELSIIAPPSDERFLLQLEDYVPGHEKQEDEQELDDEEDKMAATN
ncbi:39S ribosomal protein L1, mitochondrial [Patella vulgata]|uniref:39S ribosomal protein L1, mitochondrial n=1 Tax=Patella vulgata TaxID=6465 RepID=UPI0021801631|nr:39S ribosomal protein L1, mitochondrial [Patella vulgata]